MFFLVTSVSVGRELILLPRLPVNFIARKTTSDFTGKVGDVPDLQ